MLLHLPSKPSLLHILVYVYTGNQGSMSTLPLLLPTQFTSLTPHTSALSDQVRLLSHPAHDCRLGSLLLLNRRCQLPSGLKMNVASCFPALIISVFFWPCLWLSLSLLVRFAPRAVASRWWWSSFSGEYFILQTHTVDTANNLLKNPRRSVQKVQRYTSTDERGDSVASHFVGRYCKFI